MKAMLQSRYVGWMAVRPLTFGTEEFAPGDRIPQKHLDKMRDPEVLVRTGRIRAVAKDMNKVPRFLRKDVALESEARDKILTPRLAGQTGPVVPRHLLGTEHDPTSKAYAKALKAAEQDAEAQAAAADLDGTEEPTEVAEGTPYPVAETPGVKVGEPAATHGIKPGSDEAPADDDTQAYIEQPALNASAEEWANFAVETGQATPEEVDGVARADLIEKYQVPAEGAEETNE